MSGSSLVNGDTSFSVGIKLNVKMLPYATIWILGSKRIVLLQIQLFPFMHLQLFYLLSKLCNRQWLPKSHSYCHCRTIWHEWPRRRFLHRILICPCQYRVVVLQLFVDIPVTPMSAAGFRRLQHLAGRQTRWVTALKSRCERVQSFSSYSPGFPALCTQTGCYLAPSNRSNLKFWASMTQPHPILRAGYSLEPYKIHVLHIGFGLVCLLLAFWECVINGAQWAVNVRKMWILVHHKSL